MSKALVRIFNNGLVVVLAAILGGMASMVVLYFIFTAIFGNEPTIPDVDEAPIEALEGEGTQALESYFLTAGAIPAPFLSRDDNSVLGYVFLDVTIEVKGEMAFAQGEEAMDDMIQAFTGKLSVEGVGKANQPGIVDYDRLAQTLLSVAGEEVGTDYVAEVRVTGTDGD